MRRIAWTHLLSGSFLTAVLFCTFSASSEAQKAGHAPVSVTLPRVTPVKASLGSPVDGYGIPDLQQGVFVTGDPQFISFSGPTQMTINGDQVNIPLPGSLKKIHWQVAWEPQMETLNSLHRTSVPIATQGVHFRFWTPDVKIDKQTQLRDFLSVGQGWNSHTQRDSESIFGTLTAVKSMAHHSSLALQYRYRYDPQGTAFGFRSGDDTVGTLTQSSTQKNVYLSYNFAPSSKLSIYTAIGYSLATPDQSIFTRLAHPLGKGWGTELRLSHHQYSVRSATDMDLSLTRQMFGRTVYLTYSTQNREFSYDVADISY